VKDELEAVLDKAAQESGCRSVAIARRDGLVIVHRIALGLDPRATAALAASMVGAAEVAAQNLQQGEFQLVVVECSQGKIVAVGAGGEAIVIGVYAPDVNLGLALLGLRRASERVSGVLREW
jgi:predicted regulator of Ras-like GTPase activity (Roadblock/LC7/MglB family)